MIVEASGLIGTWKAGKLGKIPEPKTLIEYIRQMFEVKAPEFREVLTLSRRTGLSFYDASYLWLAMRYEEPILTLDTDFSRKWRTVSPDEP